MTEPTTISPPKEIYATFAGSIDQAAVARLMNSLAIMTQQGFSHIHLLFQSSGGIVGDGICLYHYWHTFPTSLTLYNAGHIASIATIAFLGGPQRLVSQHAIFVIHRTRGAEQPAAAGTTTAHHLTGVAQNLRIDDTRTEAILRERVPQLSVAQWEIINNHDLVLTAEDAVTLGIATAIGEWNPPPRQQIFNL